MSYPLTAPASGAYPLSTAWTPTSSFVNTDQNNTNGVGNYAWGAADSAPVGVRVATTGSETYTVVSGSVTTINGTAIDAVTVAVNDPVLIKDAPAATGAGSANSTQPGNGVYYVTAVAANITLARAATMSAASAQPNPAGRVVFVRAGGAVNGSSIFQLTTPHGVAAFTYGTTAMQWTKYVLTPAVAEIKTGKLVPARCATVGTETYTIDISGSVVQINGTTIDGISPALGDRILVTGAPASTGVGSALSLQPGNGVYVVTANTTNLSVSRAPEVSSTGLATPAGYSIDVMAGTLFGNTQFRVTSPSSSAAFTWGTTALRWGPVNANAVGGTLDGVIIGATTPSPSVNATTVKVTNNVTLAGTQKPWLNQTGAVFGTLSGGGNLNQLAMNDAVVGDATHYIFNLAVLDHVFSPAVGLRGGIKGWVWVDGVGVNSRLQASYVGVYGRAETGANLGGTAGDPRGAFWGGWFYAATTGGTYHDSVIGVEIDITVLSAQIDSKIGLLIACGQGDAVQGTTDDMALCIAKGPEATIPWRNGIMFGKNQDPLGHDWPFDDTCTMIAASSPGTGSGNHVNIGIDFTNVIFADAAIKVGPAPIVLSQMASAPVAASGEGRLYVASDGALHYAGPTTDTQLAPA